MPTFTSSFHHLADRLIAEQAKKRGFEDSLLFVYWQDILPPDLARWTTPKRMKFTKGGGKQGEEGRNELIVGVVPAKITEMRYFCHLIQEEINQFFSFKMVDKVTVLPDSSLLKPYSHSQQ